MSNPNKKILEIVSGLIHPAILNQQYLHQVLSGKVGYRIKRKRGIESARKLSPEAYDAVILYIHDKIIKKSTLEIIRNFVSSGGGLLALHSATASFKNEAGYFELLGGRFLSHGEICDFTIQQEKGAESIFGHMDDFTLRDELYIHEFKNKINVQFSAIGDGKNIPVIWTKEYYKGRVFYFGPGHCASSLKHSSSIHILRHGLDWVCKEI